MALAKDRVQACSFYGNVYGGPSVQVPDPSLGFLNHHKAAMLEEVESSENTSGSDSVKNFSISRLPSLSGPSNGNSTGFVFGATNSPPEEVLSIINFKTGYDHLVCPSESFLSFEQGERVSQNDYSIWADAMDKNNQWNGVNPKCVTDSRLSEDLNCFEVASGYGLMDTTAKDNQHREERFGWLCKGVVDVIEGVQQSEGPEACSQKRPYMGDNMQALKKHCTGAPRKANKANSTPSNDPQSIAAKNRRERISERLKVLQDLVPNGTKVDLVTMLEKAISYVKFLQLQVKVLATDEFWPVQGGKAPEVAQVKEAIDAILSSNRDRNSRPM